MVSTDIGIAGKASQDSKGTKETPHRKTKVMAFEIKSRDGKYYVVDTENNNKIRGTYDDEDAAEDRKDELDFRADVRSRISRMPVQEMTADEKAAAYDKMMADKAANADKNIPPKIEPTVNDKDKNSKPKKLSYWPSEES